MYSNVDYCRIELDIETIIHLIYFLFIPSYIDILSTMIFRYIILQLQLCFLEFSLYIDYVDAIVNKFIARC